MPFSSSFKKLIAGEAMAAIGMGLLNVYSLLYLLALGLEKSLIGVIGLFSGILTVVLSPVFGKLTDVRGTRITIAIGGMAVLSLLTLMATIQKFTPIVIILIIIFQGICNPAIYIGTNTMVSLMSSSNSMENAYSWYYAAILIGNTIGATLAVIYDPISIIVGEIVAYRILTWIVFGLHCVFLVFVLSTGNMRSKGKKEDKRLLPEERRRLAKYVFTQAFIYTGAGLFIYYLPVYLNLKYGLGVSTIGVLNSLSTVCTGVGIFLSPRLSKGRDPVRFIVITQMLSIPFLVIYPWLPAKYVAPVYLGRSFLMNVNMPVLTAYSMKLFREEARGRANGATGAIMSLMNSAGMFFGGILLNIYVDLLPLVCTFLYVLGIGTFYGLFRRENVCADIQHVKESSIKINDMGLEVQSDAI